MSGTHSAPPSAAPATAVDEKPIELAPEVEPETIPQGTQNRPPPPSASHPPHAPTIRIQRPSTPPPRKRSFVWRLLGTLFTLAVGVAGGLAIPYRVLDGVIPADWLPIAAPPATASAVPSAVPSASASAATPEPEPEPTPAELAASGDKEAIKKLEAIPDAERTIAQNAAIASGEVAGKLKALQKLAEGLKKNPDLAGEPGTMVTLLEYARDPHTTFAAQQVIAALKTPAAVDLLFEIWTGVRDRTPGTVLAERLVTSEEVRKHASPALAVTLDLRDVKDCDEVMKLIAKVEEVGDARAVRSLAKLATRKDCGESGHEECFPCLRERDNRKALATAALAAQKRTPPEF